MEFLRQHMRGDPGLFSFLKKASRVVFPVASLANSAQGRSVGAGLIAGGPAGAAMGGVGALGMALPGAGVSRADLIKAIGSKLLGRAGPGIKGVVGSILGGAGAAIGSGAIQQVLPFGGGPGRPAFGTVVSGSSSTSPFRRRRRMNVTNVKALRRSIRRVKGFAKIARQSLVIEKKVRAPRRGR